jgi:integrase
MLYRRGNIWWYEFVICGQRIRESTYSRSRSVARRSMERRRRSLEEGINGLSKRPRPVLFHAAASEHLALKEAKWQASTRRIESKNIEHLCSMFRHTVLFDITAADISRYQHRRQQDGASGATINLEIATLRAILRRHRLWAALQPDVGLMPRRDDVGTALTFAEEERLLSACRASRSRMLYPTVVVTLNTGLRRGELLSMRWSQIDLEGLWLKVGASKTFAGRGRLVPLNATAANALSAWAGAFPTRRPEHAAFPTECVGAAGDAFHTSLTKTDLQRPIRSLQTAWVTAKRAANVSLRWHDLRHTVCIRLLEAGLSLPLVGRLLGWSASTMVVMTHRYGHVDALTQREAMARLDRFPPQKSPQRDGSQSPTNSRFHSEIPLLPTISPSGKLKRVPTNLPTM